MAYVFLVLTISMEILATTLLKLSEGFRRLAPTLLCFGAYFVSHLCYSRVLMKMDLEVAYATWCGVGILATTLISALVFGNRLSAAGVLGLALVVLGCILLNLFGSV